MVQINSLSDGSRYLDLEACCKCPYITSLVINCSTAVRGRRAIALLGIATALNDSSHESRVMSELPDRVPLS